MWCLLIVNSWVLGINEEKYNWIALSPTEFLKIGNLPVINRLIQAELSFHLKGLSFDKPEKRSLNFLIIDFGIGCDKAHTPDFRGHFFLNVFDHIYQTKFLYDQPILPENPVWRRKKDIKSQSILITLQAPDIKFPEEKNPEEKVKLQKDFLKNYYIPKDLLKNLQLLIELFLSKGLKFHNILNFSDLYPDYDCPYRCNRFVENIFKNLIGEVNLPKQLSVNEISFLKLGFNDEKHGEECWKIRYGKDFREYNNLFAAKIIKQQLEEMKNVLIMAPNEGLFCPEIVLAGHKLQIILETPIQNKRPINFIILDFAKNKDDKRGHFFLDESGIITQTRFLNQNPDLPANPFWRKKNNILSSSILILMERALPPAAKTKKRLFNLVKFFLKKQVKTYNLLNLPELYSNPVAYNTDYRAFAFLFKKVLEPMKKEVEGLTAKEYKKLGFAKEIKVKDYMQSRYGSKSRHYSWLLFQETLKYMHPSE